MPTLSIQLDVLCLLIWEQDQEDACARLREATKATEAAAEEQRTRAARAEADAARASREAEAAARACAEKLAVLDRLRGVLRDKVTLRRYDE